MDKTALITGASFGIGKELSKKLAKKGYNLVLIARNEDKLFELKNEIQQEYDVNIEIFPKDLSKIGAAKDIYDFIISKNIQIDALVNNAGFGDYGKFHTRDLKKQSDMVQVNIIALMELTYYFISMMIDRKNGRILNVASIAAFQAGPLMSIYYASKAFVLSFTESLSVELKNTGIKVKALCPGPTDTEFAKRAELLRSGLFKNLKRQSAKQVANYAINHNGIILIPGFTNKIAVLTSKIMPRAISKWIVYYIQK